MGLLEFLKTPGWELLISKDSLIIQAPSQSAANELADNASEELAQAIANFNLKTAKIVWENCRRPFKILASMALGDENAPSGSQVNPMVFGMDTGFDAQDLRLLARMQESEKPMSLVGMEGADEDIQRWVNRPLIQMLQRSRDWATTLNITELWEADDLSYLKDILRQESYADLNDYQAYLPYSPAIFSSTFEITEFSLYPDRPKTMMRLATIHSYEPLERTTPAWI